MKQIEIEISGNKGIIKKMWDAFDKIDAGECTLKHFIEHLSLLENFTNDFNSVSGNIFVEEIYNTPLCFGVIICDYPNIKFVKALLNKIKGAFNDEEFFISYRITDDIEHQYIVHNEGEEVFWDECCIDVNCGDIFLQPYCYEPFETIDEAIEHWCLCMSCKRQYEDQTRMVNYINGYPYPNEHDNFQIHIYKTE